MEKVFLKEDNNKASIPNVQAPALFGGMWQIVRNCLLKEATGVKTFSIKMYRIDC